MRFRLLLLGILLSISAPAQTFEATLPPGGERVFDLRALPDAQLVLEQGSWDYSLEIRESAVAPRVIDAFEFGNETATLERGPARRVVIRRSAVTRGPAMCRLRVIEWTRGATLLNAWKKAEDLSSGVLRLRARGGAANVRQALADSRAAADAWRALGDASAEARATLVTGEILFALGQYDESVKSFTSALESFRRQGDSYGEASCLNNRGFSLAQQGELPPALEDLQAAAAIRKRERQFPGLAACLNNLAGAFLQAGQYDRAMRSFLEAQGLFARWGPTRGQWTVLHNLAITYYYLGQHALSAATFERAARGLLSVGDRNTAGASLANSARVHLRMGRIELAEKNARRGLEFSEQSGDPRAIAGSRNLLAETLIRAGRIDESIELESGAVELFRKARDRRGEANALINLGLAARQNGDRTGAIQCFREAVELHRAVGTPASEAAALYHLSAAQRDAGDLAGARASIEGAVAVADRLRENVAGEDLRVSFLRGAHEYYTAAVDLLMEIAAKGNEDAAAAAWRMAERGRARVVYDAIRNTRPPRENSEAMAAWERLRKIESLVDFETLQLGRIPMGQEERRKRLAALFAERDELEGRLRALDPRYAVAARIPDLDRDRLRERVLQPGVELLEYFVGENRSFVWRVNGDGVVGSELPGRRALEARARRLLAGVRTASGDPAPWAEFARAAAPLADAILPAAIRPGPDVKRLLIVPDGALSAVPFAALPERGGRALIDRLEIATAPSAGALLAIAERRQKRAPGRGVAIFADPVFDASDARLKGAPARPAERVGQSYARLPFSRAEAAALAALVPRGELTALSGFDATREAFLSKRFRNTDILHISTHASAAGAKPFLVLSEYNPAGARRKGAVAEPEIAAMDLNARLVTLNACDTAAGRYMAGEGVLSLARAFLAAGADRVLASLWKVDDEAGAALVTSFYRDMLRTTQHNPAAALRSAQLALRRDARWSAPLFWAPLVLSGEP